MPCLSPTRRWTSWCWWRAATAPSARLSPRPAPSPCTVVQGGATRADSVHNGLAAAKGKLVAIHDAARPFASEEVITQVLQAAAKTGAAARRCP